MEVFADILRAGPAIGFYVFLAFLAVSFIARAFKQRTEGGVKPPGPRYTPQRKTLEQLIEEVRMRASGVQPPHPPKPGTGPQPSKPMSSQPYSPQRMQPQGGPRVPSVPKLTPVGQPRQPAYQQPYVPQPPRTTATPTLAPKRQQSIRADMSHAQHRAQREAAEQREEEASRRGHAERRRHKELAKRAKELDKKASDLDHLRRRYERKIREMTEAGSGIHHPEGNYQGILGSSKAIKNAIVLREILGPPRAFRGFTSRQH